MKIEINKELIIEALRKEPIARVRPERWFHVVSTDESVTSIAEATQCPRCAVGATFANVLDPATTLWDAESVVGHVIDSEAQAQEELGVYYDYTPEGYYPGFRHVAQATLDAGYPITALSYYFESACLEAADYGNRLGPPDNQSVQAALDNTISFVELCYPPTIVIDIDGGRPAKDIKVL